jgi:hypothetical protein
VLRVIDDGILGNTPALVSDSAGAGVGLRNTRARLEQLYGTAQSFSLTRDGIRGVVAEVRLPFHTNGGDHSDIAIATTIDDEVAAAETHHAR